MKLKFKKSLFALISVLCSLLICSCSKTKYFVEKESRLYEMDIENNQRIYIPIEDEALLNSDVLNKTYAYLNTNKKVKAENFLIEILEMGNPILIEELHLANAVFYTYSRNYSLANISAREIKNRDHDFVRKLLLIDTTYEIEKKENKKVKSQNLYLEQYQTLLDEYPDKEYLKHLIALRIKRIRYEN